MTFPIKNVALFAIMAGLLVYTGMTESWNTALGLFNMCLISAIMALTGWAVFIWAFDTRFPRGWFENTMRALTNG